MDILGYWNLIIKTGVNPNQAYTFSDKLQARNRLAFLCVIFSLIYFAYFLFQKQYLPFIAISLGICLFVLSIILNKYQKYSVSSLLILVNTNYCVLFFSIYIGFDSGIHLYLFTSPLIVLTLFDTKKTLFIALAMLSYILNFFLIVSIDKIYKIDFNVITQKQQEIFYLINFICSTVILMALALYFLYNNNKVNQLLILKNQQLIHQQTQLQEENKIRKLAEEQAITSLGQREILLSETHHRVKNNLAVVTALIDLQTFYLNDDKTIQILKESQNRIKSIALLHEKLYENTSLQDVDVALYTNELIHYIQQSVTINKHINIHTEIDEINLAMSSAMPFGLMLNELITNSYKYAFLKKEQGNIWISIKLHAGNCCLQYKDDGAGFDYNDEIKTKSLGLNLIESFCVQLNGKFAYKREINKMIFELIFPISK